MAKEIMSHESRSTVWDGGECHHSHGKKLKDSDGARLRKRMREIFYICSNHAFTDIYEWGPEKENWFLAYLSWKGVALILSP